MKLIFNELSICNSDIEEYDATAIIEQFIYTYSAVVKQSNCFERSIITNQDLNRVFFSKDYTIAKWRNQCQDKDLVRRFHNICERQNIVNLYNEDSELKCEKGIAQGLLFAYENEEFCISFAQDNFWDNSSIECMYYNIECEEEINCQVPNFSNPMHFETHKDLMNKINSKKYIGIHTAEQLFDSLSTHFPSLVFHEVAKNQIKYQVSKQYINAM